MTVSNDHSMTTEMQATAHPLTNSLSVALMTALAAAWGQCRNLHFGVPGYRRSKMISTHFRWLATDFTTTFPQSTSEGKTRLRRSCCITDAIIIIIIKMLKEGGPTAVAVLKGPSI